MPTTAKSELLQKSFRSDGVALQAFWHPFLQLRKKISCRDLPRGSLKLVMVSLLDAPPDSSLSSSPSVGGFRPTEFNFFVGVQRRVKIVSKICCPTSRCMPPAKQHDRASNEWMTGSRGLRWTAKQISAAWAKGSGSTGSKTGVTTKKDKDQNYEHDRSKGSSKGYKAVKKAVKPDKHQGKKSKETKDAKGKIRDLLQRK